MAEGDELQDLLAGISSDDVQDGTTEDLGGEITRAELETCCRVLTVLAADLSTFSSPAFKQLRLCLQPLLNTEQSKRFSGGSKEDIASRKQELQALNRAQQQAKSHDKRFINNTMLRAGRIARLEALKANTEADDALDMLVPDGVPLLAGSARPAIMPSHGHNTTAEAEAAPAPGTPQDGATLNFHRSCYICKRRFNQLHFFYDQLCPSCADLNYRKRLQAASMKDKVALVTGARVKIGFRVCLKLLRCGATVVATTRFPLDALHRLREEADFEQFQHRLQVVGVDLRDVAAVEELTDLVGREYGRVDILVNNACQTVRRPAAYYQHQVRKEATLASELTPTVTQQLSLHHKFERRLAAFPHALPSSSAQFGGAARSLGEEGVEIRDGRGGSEKEGDARCQEREAGGRVDREGERGERERGHGSEGMGGALGLEVQGEGGGGEWRGVSRSALLSQVALMEQDTGVREGGGELPAGVYDVNGSQVDLRSTNSWLLRLDQVSTPELMEVMCVNAVAPFTLCSRLEPLMRRRGRSDNTDTKDKTHAQASRRSERQEADDAGQEGGVSMSLEVVRGGTGQQSVEPEPEGGWAFVVNVSAMEGKFYRHKTAAHPHTNMAKAALNMLTRTSAQDLKTKGILMNAVDTGWINDENPSAKAMEYARRSNFQTPIDEEDAAARILDPVMVGVRGEATLSGLFLKDYFPTEW